MFALSSFSPFARAALSSTSARLLLIAAGVVLGLLAIALLVWPEAQPAHGHLLDAAKRMSFVPKKKSFGIIWH